MDLTIASTPAVQPVVEDSGFKLVEEDDVAFALSLCREIHRIYGDYQDGTVGPTAEIRSGLLMTWDVLGTLQRTVVDGMPALRIQVASAQTREMATVLFGQPLPGRSVAASVARSGRSSPTAQIPPGEGPPALGGPPGPGADRSWAPPADDTRLALPLLDTPRPHPLPADRLSGGAGRPVPEPSLAPERSVAAAAPASRHWTELWSAPPAGFRLLLGFLACCVIGALVDVPLAVLAIFPDVALQLAVAFVIVPVLIFAGRRVLRRRHPSPERVAAA